MAMLSTSRKLNLIRTFTPRVKINCIQFHTLKRVDNRLITGKIPRELLTPKRNYFWIFRRLTKREVKSVDKPPNNYELIYRCDFDNYLLSFQHLGFYATIIVCLITILKSHHFADLPPKKPESVGEEPNNKPKALSVDENEAVLFVSAFLLVFCVIHFFIGKIPVRIYCNPQHQQYLFYFYGTIPSHLRTANIKVGQIQHKVDGGIIMWKEQTYEYKKTGQKLLLFEEYFRCPADLYVMLGWQKDPNVNYDNPESEKAKAKGPEDGK